MPYGAYKIIYKVMAKPSQSRLDKLQRDIEAIRALCDSHQSLQGNVLCLVSTCLLKVLCSYSH